jgi:iron complex transport system substrate-binding protein
MRLVTLACSNTEIVCALGCADWIVGCDDHSDHPPQVVAGIPRVGPDLTPSMERIAALQPDLVLASLTVPGHEEVIARLDAAGLPFLAFEPTRIEHVYRDIRQIAQALGVVERGERLVTDLRTRLETPPPQLTGPPPRVAVQWWPKPVILPGRESWVHQLLERAGAQNLLGGEAVKSRPVSDEELRELAPDVIVLAWCGVKVEKYRPDVVYRNPLWQNVPAVVNRRVIPIAETFLGRPSPLLARGFEELRRVVRAAAAGPS